MISEGETSKSAPISPQPEAVRKRIISPKPSSSKSTKFKKPSFLKKLKSKSKSIELESETAYPESVSSPIERRTPEGEDPDYFDTEKFLSESNLTESSFKSDDISVNSQSLSFKSVVENTPGSSVINRSAFERRERTKSLDNLTVMPAYGELIVDSNTVNANASGSKPKDHLYKILVIGDGGTGKTSIIKRYVHRFFTQHYRSTIGVDFALKVLNWDENTHIRLQLWDIAGQERYGNMTRVYYKEAVGAFIVFDVTRSHTLESVSNWKSDLDSKVTLSNDQPVPCVLLANKCDQPKEGIVNNPQKMDDYCREKGFSAWFETSAKDNINIDEAARALVQKILDNDALINNDVGKDGEQFSLTKEANQHNNKKKSCNC